MRYCLMCGSSRWIERHHIFNGAYRKKSEKYGLVIDLCHYCHNEPPNGVHYNPGNMKKLKRYGQLKAMSENGWTVEEFIKQFGKNYL